MITKNKRLVTPTNELRLKALVENNWCTPESIELIKDYAFKITSSHEHSRGVSWTAVVYKNGKPQFNVENLGDGGSNHYWTIPGGDHKTMIRLHDEFLKIAKQIYPNNQYEQDDCLCSFLDLIADI